MLSENITIKFVELMFALFTLVAALIIAFATSFLVEAVRHACNHKDELH